MSRIKSYCIGRSSENDIQLNDDTVSRKHAELTISNSGNFYITDCCSTHGTKVYRNNDWETIQQDFINKQERLRFGEYEMWCSELVSLLKQKPKKGNEVDDSRGLKRDPATGEIIEKE